MLKEFFSFLGGLKPRIKRGIIMEHPSQKIISTLEQIILLLKICDAEICEYYCGYLEHILIQLKKPHEIDKIAQDILDIYGGMCSFNDIGIVRNTEPVLPEYLKFCDLREELYLACKEAILVNR